MTFLSVIETGHRLGRHNACRVRCICGTEKLLRAVHLPRVQSCGCKRNELISKANRRHGMSHTPEHMTWVGMIQRCSDSNCKSYKNYGGRGITVCERWLVFENFLADMGDKPPGLTIERVNNDAGYSPDNCIWADRFTQARNKRPRARI